MSEPWVPDAANEDVEKRMEEMELPESDRDEVRRFSEFLKRRKDKRDGKELPPAPPGMREWALGEDQK